MKSRDTNLAVIAAALLGLTLSACGKLGPLDQPAPMFGDRARADYEAKKAADVAAKADKQAQTRAPTRSNAIADQPDPEIDNAPKTKRDIVDPNQRLTPLSATPVDGSPNLMGAPVSTRPPN